LVGSASAWGGNPDKDAIYLNVTPAENDGKTIYKLRVDKNVPVDGFWSISLYNAKGYFEQNPYNAYALNNITAKKDDDGSVNVQSAAATARSRTACRSCPDGTTWFDSINHARKFSRANGNSRKLSPHRDKCGTNYHTTMARPKFKWEHAALRADISYTVTTILPICSFDSI
jgi:Protein of unknown function (DUF1214)